jgi:endonuclease/exonuclease/phosphatase family metal-dependent hydrolase
MNLTITTFNLENLFSRYVFLDDPAQPNNQRVVMSGISSINYQGNPLSPATTQIQRNNTARAILDSRPDILAVQEVENLWTLRLFNDQYLSGYFGQMILLEGNDGRGIDVGLCIKKNLNIKCTGILTHVDDLDPNRTNKTSDSVQRYYNDVTNEITVVNALFSRDCLEVCLDVVGTKTLTPLTLLVNHFKAQDESAKSDVLRKNQAEKVVDYVKASKANLRLPIVIGDLNEDFFNKPSNLQPLQDLISQKILTDPFANDAEADCWTHYYENTDESSRLDYILPDASLNIASKSILRKGIMLKCAEGGERYPTIGYVDTEASDHCPVSLVLSLPD